jgi:cell division protein FtsB
MVVALMSVSVIRSRVSGENTKDQYQTWILDKVSTRVIIAKQESDLASAESTNKVLRKENEMLTSETEELREVSHHGTESNIQCRRRLTYSI